MYESHKEGGTIVRPTFFEFFYDDKTFEDTEQTFMVGPSILVAPVLSKLEGEKKYNVHFPAGKWVDLHNLAAAPIDTITTPAETT